MYEIYGTHTAKQKNISVRLDKIKAGRYNNIQKGCCIKRLALKVGFHNWKPSLARVAVSAFNDELEHQLTQC